MFSNLKIGARLGLAFLSVLILLLAMAFSGITKLHNLQQEIEEIASKRYPEVIGANDIKTTALDNARLVRNTILITDEKRMAAAKADYDKNVTRIGARIDDLEKGMATDEGKRLIAALRQARDTYNAYTGEVMQLALDQKKSEATATLYGEKSKSIGTYVAAVEKVIGFQDAMMKGTVNRSQEAYTSGKHLLSRLHNCL